MSYKGIQRGMEWGFGLEKASVRSPQTAFSTLAQNEEYTGCTPCCETRCTRELKSERFAVTASCSDTLNQSYPSTEVDHHTRRTPPWSEGSGALSARFKRASLFKNSSRAGLR